MEESSKSNAYLEELEVLKLRAQKLGIKYSPNIGVDALRAKVNEALTPEEPEKEEESEEETPASIRKKMYQEQMRLIRCSITNLNPMKKDLHGEIWTVANKYLGTVRKYVPYDEAGKAYHLPYILFNELKNRKFIQRQTVTDPNTKEQRVISRWVPEFNLEILPPLTKEQIAKLASSQRAHNAIDADSSVI